MNGVPFILGRRVMYSYGVGSKKGSTEGEVSLVIECHVSFGFRCIRTAVIMQVAHGCWVYLAYLLGLSQVMQVVHVCGLCGLRLAC